MVLKIFTLHMIALIFFCQNLYAAGQSAFDFLLNSPGARSSALGNAYVGISEGADTFTINPAGLANQKKQLLSFQHVSFVEGILNDNIVFIQPQIHGAWGVHVGHMGVRNLKRTVADSTVSDGFREVGDFSTNNIQFAFAYARKIAGNFNAGITSRFIRESLSDESAIGLGFDLGLVYNDTTLPIQFGTSIQHLGTKVKFKNESFNLPRLIRLGFSIKQPDKSYYKWIPTHSLITLELLRTFEDGDSTIGAGVEVPVMNEKITLRTGFNHNAKKQNLGNKASLPRGISLGVGIKPNTWSLDYALNSFGDLGLTHRVSLSATFGSGF